MTDDTVRRARDGDPEAFDELYETNVGRVYALCLRMTADAGLAEELAQDVFVRVWRKIHTFRGRSAFSTWLHRLTVNVVLDAQRRRSRGADRTRRLTDEDLLGSSTVPDPTGRLALERAVADLPDRARTALVLHTVEGYRYEEVADLMNISLGAVKSHIHRARRLLLESWDPA